MGGKYRFRLRAPNNKIIAVSQGYESKTSCINGVMSVQKNCESHVEDQTTKMMEKLTNPKYEVFTDSASKFRFHLKASNGEIIAASEGYESKEGVTRGIEAVQKSCDAEIEDLTTTQTEKVMSVEAKMEEATGEITTKLMFDPPKTASVGTTITLTGKLVKADSGEGVADGEIEIYDADRSFLKDDLMASGMTNADGSFSIDWHVKPMDWYDDTVEVYALFLGMEPLKPTCSKKNIMKLTFEKFH
jgi:uncharacterized protein YegP (UPF0339 family)